MIQNFNPAFLDGKNVLITGGTGSFGKTAARFLLENGNLNKLIIFSRDELKQHEMALRLPPEKYPAIRYFIGDVRDFDRLLEAFSNVDYVIHAAAMKQVPASEYNPFEAIKTNVHGAQNVLRAAIQRKVKRVIALSTDKAANPINLYGATKLCSDKLFIAANAMAADSGTRFSVVRYGNVVGSRGSVIPLFLQRRDSGVIPVTDERMTRFSITLPEGVKFSLQCLERMVGGEIFVPKIPSYRITDVAKAVAPSADVKLIGIRSGEKLHEVMVPLDEASQTLEFDDHYLIQPRFDWWEEHRAQFTRGRQCADDFCYSSETNTEWLSVEDLKKLVDQYERGALGERHH